MSSGVVLLVDIVMVPRASV